MRLADAFPKDLWGAEARQRARKEAVKIDGEEAMTVARQKELKKRGTPTKPCPACKILNAIRRKWCSECGKDL